MACFYMITGVDVNMWFNKKEIQNMNYCKKCLVNIVFNLNIYGDYNFLKNIS